MKKLIKKASSKSRERYNYQMTKKISETLANQIKEDVIKPDLKVKVQRRGKSDRKTS